MAKRKLTATQRLRQNVNRQIRRLEERGYRFSDDLKQMVKTAKYQTLKSLQNKKYSKLLQEATAEIDGEIVSGTLKRQEEQREQWEKRRRSQDAIDWDKIEYTDVTQSTRLYNEGSLIYDNIMYMIDTYPDAGAKILAEGLTSEIRRYGEYNVLSALAQLPEKTIEDIQKIVFYSENEKGVIHSAASKLFEGIKGTILSEQEAKQLGDTLDAMTDFDTYD